MLLQVLTLVLLHLGPGRYNINHVFTSPVDWLETEIEMNKTPVIGGGLYVAPDQKHKVNNSEVKQQ
jgi:hypothetical protein